MGYCISLKLLQIQLIVLYILHEEVKRLSGKKYFYPIARKYNLSHCISCIARELSAVCILGHYAGSVYSFQAVNSRPYRSANLHF
jgi:hypothetical protein